MMRLLRTDIGFCLAYHRRNLHQGHSQYVRGGHSTLLLPCLGKVYSRGLDAKRIMRQYEKNELRSVIEWYPAANDVGEMFSSITLVNSTLPAFERTVFLYLMG